MDLNKLSSTQLQEIKTRWYDEARATGNNIGKLYTIARYLGTPVLHNYGPKYRFEHNKMVIYVDDYGHYMTVHLGDKLIVSTHNERLYAKGEWEEQIDSLFDQAEAKRISKQTEREQEEKKMLLSQLTAIS